MLRWTFNDGSTTVTLDINPSSMDSPFFKRTISTQENCAGTDYIVTEGAATAATMSFSGLIRFKAEYDRLFDWFLGQYSKQRIYITDHFGRELMCVPVSFDPKPRRNTMYYWAHDFTASVVVLSVGTATRGDDGAVLTP
jgi:hypothetical protein